LLRSQNGKSVLCRVLFFFQSMLLSHPSPIKVLESVPIKVMKILGFSSYKNPFRKICTKVLPRYHRDLLEIGECRLEVFLSNYSSCISRGHIEIAFVIFVLLRLQSCCNETITDSIGQKRPKTTYVPLVSNKPYA
jgi:hypothetical protein